MPDNPHAPSCDSVRSREHFSLMSSNELSASPFPDFEFLLGDGIQHVCLCGQPHENIRHIFTVDFDPRSTTIDQIKSRFRLAGHTISHMAEDTDPHGSLYLSEDYFVD